MSALASLGSPAVAWAMAWAGLPAMELLGWLSAGLAGTAAGVLGVHLLQLRGRLEATARAEHELRGPATVLLLACDRMRRDPSGRRHARALEVELERMAAGLAALTAARTGRPVEHGAGPGGRARDLETFTSSALAGWAPALAASGRAARFEWDAGKVGLPHQRGAIASALGNLVANAAEHGAGAVEVEGARAPGVVRVKVSNRTPAERGSRRHGGRGLGIASAAAREAGGGVSVTRAPDRFQAVLELPLDPVTAFDERPRRSDAG